MSLCSGYCGEYLQKKMSEDVLYCHMYFELHHPDSHFWLDCFNDERLATDRDYWFENADVNECDLEAYHYEQSRYEDQLVWEFEQDVLAWQQITREEGVDFTEIKPHNPIPVPYWLECVSKIDRLLKEKEND